MAGKYRLITYFIPIMIALAIPVFAAPLTDDVLKKPTSQQVLDQRDLQSAVTAYRFWYPSVSAEAIFDGNRTIGILDNKGISILLAKPHHVGFTLNSDTPYAGGVLDLSQGPMVIELPSGPYIGLIDDHHQRWILDLGIPGADHGQGGKYLIVPPGYQDKIPAGYFVGRSESLKVLLALRALPANGNIEKAMAQLQAIKIYPFATINKPELLKFVDVTHTAMNNTPLNWETNLQYWEKLHQIINDEPMVNEFKPMYGLLAAIGIEKGKPFAPDARMKKILAQAAVLGHEQMLVSAFASSRADKIAWPDRTWEWVGLVADNGNFETKSGLDLEARDRWFAQAIVSSPSMFRRLPGSGSLYWLAIRDNQNAYLEGSNSYSLRIPLPVPSKLFWSLTVYDVETRSEIQTDQNKAALSSLFDFANEQKQTSITLYFGPTPPIEKNSLWIKTIAGKKWFAYLRIYGPEQAAFDGSWKPGDIEQTK